MTRIYTPISIPLPIETVFDYATTPGNWPQWHPSSLGVSGATDHSLEIGEQVTEKFLVAGRQGQATWTVRERAFPHRWVIEANVAGQTGRGIVSYTLSTRADGTFFEREFVYTTPNLLLSLLDRLILRRRIQAESWQAVRQLKHVLLEQQEKLTREAL
jgi:uncharacterized protein YndB with AHSA1/START domain